MNIWQSLIWVHPSITDIEQRRQSKLLAMLAVAHFIAGLVALMSGIINVVRLGDDPIQLIAISPVLAISLTALYLNRRGNYRPAAWLIVFGLFVIVLEIWLITGLETVMFYFIALLFVSVALLKRREIILSVVGSIVILMVYLVVTPSTITLPAQAPVTLLLYNLPILFMYIRHRDQLEMERQKELLHANERLQESETSLEQRVAARTRDLEVAADVSRQITTILDLNKLLDAIVERTKAGFNLYHVSIFLYDETSQRVTLEAGAGSVGKLLKAEGRSFYVPEDQGLVPTSVRTRQPVVINNVTQESQYAPNPHLPNTRSEIALPMLFGEKVVGVLDLQSELLERFSEDDIRIMKTLAEHIAIAVENARLYDQQVQFAQQLREIDEVKSRFLASMSHELRTPLNAILNFTRFVSSGIMGPVTEKQLEALNKVTGSGRHLLALINDVLDITKIESGMLNLFVETDINLQLELETVVATAETLLSEKPQVKLIRDIDPQLPDIVADKRRIRQILLNLVSNACKFTDAGSVTVSAHLNCDKILMSVKDTGPGIAPEEQSGLFEAFRQTKVGLSQGGGTGLGLAIALRLAQAHEGRLWLESEVGVGSTFYVEIPSASESLKAQIIIEGELAL
jgi:signal transduction histidine kinase